MTDRAQQDAVIDAAIKAAYLDPRSPTSLGAIAEMLPGWIKADHKRVGRRLAKLAATGALPQLEKTLGKHGRRRRFWRMHPLAVPEDFTPQVKLIAGDALAELRRLLADPIDCCVTSPPYYLQGDYDDDRQIGREDAPEEYVGRLVRVFAEVERLLKPHGTVWLIRQVPTLKQIHAAIQGHYKRTGQRIQVSNVTRHEPFDELGRSIQSVDHICRRHYGTSLAKEVAAVLGRSIALQQAHFVIREYRKRGIVIHRRTGHLPEIEQGLEAERIHQDLVAEHGDGAPSYYRVRRFIARLRHKTPLPFRRRAQAIGHRQPQGRRGAGRPVRSRGPSEAAIVRASLRHGVPAHQALYASSQRQD